jgi:hypothetical protein
LRDGGELARALGYYLARPTLAHLHSVTVAMAVEILARHMPAKAAAAALAQARAEHGSLHRGASPADQPRPANLRGNELALTAVRSRDAHQVKLVEACQRGQDATGDPAFAPQPRP